MEWSDSEDLSETDEPTDRRARRGGAERRRRVRIGLKPSCKIRRAAAAADNVLNMIDTYDRPGSAFADLAYADADGYATPGFEDKPMKRVPKAGVYAAAGLGIARAEWSVCEATAKGPNASARAEASALGARAFLNAEVASASATAGPVHAKVGLGLETGIGIGSKGFEGKFLGTGFSVGPKTGVSVLGNELSVECPIQ